ncbi:MAG: hypothetical protein E6G89_13735 [Alphaproteobacteria bacterium]|nr:MAG: hypothetical protein E6G89_13735 [Alphaproteobacteria bacterium]
MTTAVASLGRLPVLRIALAGLVVLALAFYFWSQSRYPQLNDKAVMSGTIQLEDPLSFEAAVQFEPTAPMWQKIAYTTLNWIKTNRRGMTFGVLFGAAFLTLMRYLPRRSFRGSFANSALGLALGAPLGVCVNCAAPIAKGLFNSGARVETALSAMVASPTLNIVVVAMAFSILPFYVAMTKLVLSLAVILLGVPLVVRMLPQAQREVAFDIIPEASCAIPANAARMEGPVSAIAGFFADFAKDFWYIVRMTVPLMLLAGFLGAIGANLLPLEMLKDMPINPITLVAIAALGVFLPVPIAFDVVIAATLLNAGLPISVVMVLVFTLGIFSVYSFMIVASSMSWRAAFLISGLIVALAVIAGLGTDFYNAQIIDRSQDYLRSEGAASFQAA